LKVLNSVGACVEELNNLTFGAGTRLGRLDCSTWSAGVYTIQLIHESGIESVQFIKE
jgi:hypothetical protein